MKPSTILVAAVACLLWIAWGVLVVTTIVPHIRRHLTMWPWLMSYVLCLAPVLFVAGLLIARTRTRP